MPGRNGTGPTSQGPRTGRGLGNCTSDKAGDQQKSSLLMRSMTGQGTRFWNTTLGRLFFRRHGGRNNQN